MKVEDHITQTVLVGLLVTGSVSALIALNGGIFQEHMVIFIFIGVVIGAYFPNADVIHVHLFLDKMREHANMARRSKDFSKKIHHLFDFVDYSVHIMIAEIIRTLLYSPAYMLVNMLLKISSKSQMRYDKDHGLSHSLLGVFAGSIIFSVYLSIMSFFSDYSLFIASIGFFSFFTSGIVHLLQDSTGKPGVKWLYPFRRVELSGGHTKRPVKTAYVNGALIVAVITNYYLSRFLSSLFRKSFISVQTAATMLLIIPLLMLMVIFYGWFSVAKVRVG